LFWVILEKSFYISEEPAASFLRVDGSRNFLRNVVSFLLYYMLLERPELMAEDSRFIQNVRKYLK